MFNFKIPSIKLDNVTYNRVLSTVSWKADTDDSYDGYQDMVATFKVRHYLCDVMVNEWNNRVLIEDKNLYIPIMDRNIYLTAIKGRHFEMHGFGKIDQYNLVIDLLKNRKESLYNVLKIFVESNCKLLNEKGLSVIDEKCNYEHDKYCYYV